MAYTGGQEEGKDMRSLFTKVAGVSRANDDGSDRQQVLQDWRTLQLVRDPDNPYDKNAVKVCLATGRQLGFLSGELAADLAPKIDKGKRIEAVITEVTGGPEEGKTLGCNLKVLIY
jgi:single-stranded-DNA-specific exonuclease